MLENIRDLESAVHCRWLGVAEVSRAGNTLHKEHFTMINSTQYDSSQSSSQSSVSGLFYFLVGAGIGAGLGLLFAPKSGTELRTDISDITRKGYDETLDLAHQIKEQSAEVYNQLKEKTGKVYDLAATKLSTATDLPNEMMDVGKQLAPQSQSQKRSTGRQSAEIH
jgi:gas vesicle protein